MNGICTLANDYVFDQLVALLNSIDAILGKDIPVCIYPFDDKTQRIADEIAKRPNVFIYDDQESINSWDQFMLSAAPERLNRSKFRLYGAHRRFCAFDGPFDKFIYLDADTLVMNSLATVFEKLDSYDFVVYDFQFKDVSKVYKVNSPKLREVFPQFRIDSEIFCSGFYGSKHGIFNSEQRESLLLYLQNGDREILYEGAGEQPLLNYMVMRANLATYNFAQQLPSDEATGCSISSKHFEEREHILYDRGNRLTYLHYIGIPPNIHQAVCAGENIEFPYRELFLYYRYLHEPEKRPVFAHPPKPCNAPPPNLLTRALRKFKLIPQG
ncbi:sugar transferase [Calothrix sp. FACHB-1219]|uniref:Npun_R2821/Npun_R2822 family protein n=1 Tax=unclassified Calothrix TaxID=2619626 RepID=UPI001688407B|nr:MULTISPECIES: Npun_R2821/Npun_R2822 family protein [unclassified Calothrix]MBD2201095.1 sugar transferase [Calothrix sp. FACHB-168]MBD2215528.1 sugar transferase [Calothrix sp. FACHB-1219]